MESIVELKKEGGYWTVKVIFEGPIVSEPTPRIVIFVEFANQNAGVGVLEKCVTGGALKQERHACQQSQKKSDSPVFHKSLWLLEPFKLFEHNKEYENLKMDFAYWSRLRYVCLCWWGRCIDIQG
jgi:hypothetical protein